MLVGTAIWGVVNVAIPTLVTVMCLVVLPALRRPYVNSQPPTVDPLVSNHSYSAVTNAELALFAVTVVFDTTASM